MQSENGTDNKPGGIMRHVARAICLLIAGVTLAGCIVAPYPGYYRQYPRYYYR